jgi:methylthioribulose-1-phosphate dehydratase
MMKEESINPLASQLAATGRYFHGRGWALGTSGNFSAVLSRDPLRLAITASGLDKGALTAEQILTIDESARVVAGNGKPSDETKLHLAVVRQRGAGAVLHTHSVWSTILSEMNKAAGGLEISGLEMLKGLSGVRTHEHREWVPIIDNGQEMDDLAARADATLAAHPAAHGILLRGHGLYTWGKDLAEARRQIEIFEFLFEVVGRLSTGGR